jgi:Protein kinase domain
MGVVYAARHLELGREVALKLLPPHAVDSPAALERFAREARTAASLRHPGIVGIHDFGQADGVLYLAMELVVGEALESVLRRGPLEPRRAARLVEAMARAVAYAHESGVLHRDLKPHNVILDSDGRARITDFGLGKDMRDTQTRLTKTGEVLGTPAYMPPEQAAGEVDRVGPQSDVYGLGATLFALLTGRAPFEGASPVNIITRVLRDPAPSPSSTGADVDHELNQICLRCLEKEPEGRYPSADALAEDLERYLRGEEPMTRARPRRGRGRLIPGLALAAALVGVTAGAWFLRGSFGEETSEATEAAGRDRPRLGGQTTSPPPSSNQDAPAGPVRLVARWEQRGRSAPWPPARRSCAMAYVPGVGVVVQGGDDFQSTLADTWVWDGARWSELGQEGGVLRTEHALAYDPVRGRLVLFGGTTVDSDRRGEGEVSRVLAGSLGDVREWDGERWASYLGKGGGPGPLFAPALAYDPERRVVVVVGGAKPASGDRRWSSSSATWCWDGEEWRTVESRGGEPPGRAVHGLAYDPTTAQLLLFGGADNPAAPWVGPFRGDTWTLTRRGWVQPDPAPAPAPAARRSFALASTPLGVVLYGGWSTQIHDDTWLWRDGRWEQLATPNGQPPILVYMRMAYDEARGVVVLFGGSRRPRDVVDQVWELSLVEEEP